MTLRTTQIEGREFKVGDIIRDMNGNVYIAMDWGMIDFEFLFKEDWDGKIHLKTDDQYHDPVGLSHVVSGDIYRAVVLDNILTMLYGEQ